MRHKDFNLQQVIDALQGTCMNTLDSMINELYPGMNELDLTVEEIEEFDREIFNCETCGWWYEISSQAEDGVNCDDCAGENCERE